MVEALRGTLFISIRLLGAFRQQNYHVSSLLVGFGAAGLAVRGAAPRTVRLPGPRADGGAGEFCI